MLTPRPGFGERIVISISPRFTVLPELRRRRSYKTQVIGSAYHGRTITLRQAYYRNAYFLPLTLDGYEFFVWRSAQETADQIKVASTDQLRSRDNSRGGLRVTIPIKSKAVQALFGEGGAGLQVSGSRRISIGGVSNWSDEVSTQNKRQSKFPSLRMDQTFQFNIVGTVGSKIFVKVNQDSRVNIPLANRLEIRFRGSDDDVIKTIEAGNTTLSLPGASLLRYSSQIRGLFGIKAEAQVGPLRWIGIASQEKANTERATVVSGSTPQGDTLRDYEFVRYQKFDLFRPFSLDSAGLNQMENEDDSIIKIEVYEKVAASAENPIQARMFVDPRPDPAGSGDVRDKSQFADEPVREIPRDRFFLDVRERTILFNQPIGRNIPVGVWMRLRRSADNGGGEYEIGSKPDANNFILKLIKLENDAPGSTVQNYEWLNMYRLSSSLGFDFEDPDFDALDLQVYRGDIGTEGYQSNLNTQESVPLIQIIGMDQFSSTGKTPDLKADLNTVLLNLERRLLILPSRRPFDTSRTFGSAPMLNPRVPDIYNTLDPIKDRNNASRYYFVITSKIRSSSIRLSGANIVEGSEVVTTGGVQLVRGQDYNVLGNTIQLISERATDPGANITVDYEVAPLFTVEKKTLLGTRLEYQRGKDFSIGTTLLFKSDKATTRKPRVGQETAKMFAWDTNLAAKFRPNFLTRMVDAIPGVRAQGPSTISIQAEVARSHPNPNVDGEAFIDDFEGSRQKISLTPQRSRWRTAARPANPEIDPKSTNRAHIFWYNTLAGEPTTAIFNQDAAVGANRTYPLNIVVEPSETKIDTQITTINIDTTFYRTFDTTFDTSFGTNFDTTFDTTVIDSIIFIDTTFDTTLDIIIDTTLDSASTDTTIVGAVSFYDVPESSRSDLDLYELRAIPVDVQKNWAGITQRFSGGAANQSNAELLEVRLRITQKRVNQFDPLIGFIHFDFGLISEDVYPNGVLDQEGGTLNNVYDLGASEDVGLDGRTTAQEALWYNSVLADLAEPGDPSRDDYPYTDDDATIQYPRAISLEGILASPLDTHLIKLRKINGLENNILDPDLVFVDSEDLDGDRQSDRTNAYFSFKAALDPRDTSGNNFFVSGSQNNDGWVTLRIPIRDSSAVDTIIGSPVWSNIRYARIWLDSLQDTTMLEIASMVLVSSNWDDKLVFEPSHILTDTTLSIDFSDSIPDTTISINVTILSPSKIRLAVISEAEDVNYDSPPGVQGSVDINTGAREPEQSLRLDYEDLINGDTAIIFKLQTAANYTGYRELRMFVHGGPRVGSNPLSDSDQVFFFFRLGSDPQNYYEFHTLLEPGWAESNEVVMDFDDLTGLKDQAIEKKSSDIDDGQYRVFGRPTLRTVRYISAGFYNADQSDNTDGIDGSIWLDELRLTEVRRNVGTAGRVSLSGNLGDFVTNYGISVSFQDPFYRNIAGATRGGSANSLGSGRSELRYQMNLNLQADKFLPPSLGASIPVSFSFSRSETTPLLITAGNSDIRLPDERRDEEKTIQQSRGFSIRESFRKNTKNPLFTILLNKLRTSFDYTRTKGSSPTVPSSLGENYSASVTYDPQKMPEIPKLPVFFMFSKVPVLNRLSGSRLNLMPNSFSIRSNFRRTLTVTKLDKKGTITSRHSRTLNSDITTGARWMDNLSSTYRLSIRSDLRNPDWVNLSLKDFRLGKVTRLQQSVSTDFSPTLFRFLTHKFSASSSYNENRQQNVVDLSLHPGDSALEPLNVSQNIRLTVSGNFDLQKFLGDPGSAAQVSSRASDSRKRNLERVQALQRLRAGLDSAVVDSSEQEVEEQSDAPGGPWVGKRAYNLTRRGLKKLTGFIDPVSGSIERSENRSMNGLRIRPAPDFRFGFRRTFDTTAGNVVTLTRGQLDEFSETFTWRASSGIRVLGGALSSKIDLSESISRSEPSTGVASQNIDRTWPRLSIRIGQMHTFQNIWGLRVIQRFYNSLVLKFGPRTSYSRGTRKREVWDSNTGKYVATSKSLDVDQTPLLGVTIPIRRQMTLNARFERTSRKSERFLSEGPREDALISASIETSKTFRMSTSYSFRAPNGIRLPIFGRIRIQSNITMNLDILKRFSETKTASSNDSLIVTAKRETFSVTTNMNYSFSSQVSGGMSTSWTDTSDLSGRKTHTRELRFFAQMRF